MDLSSPFQKGISVGIVSIWFGEILIDFPRVSHNRKKILHEFFSEIGSKNFSESSFLGFSRLVIYEMYIPRNFSSLESFYVDSDTYNFQNHLRSLWRKSKELKSKNNVQFLCGTTLFKNLKSKKVPPFINIVERLDFPDDHGELMDVNRWLYQNLKKQNVLHVIKSLT